VVAHPARERQPRGGAATSRSVLPCPPRRRPRGALRTRPGLPGRSAGKRGRRGPHPTWRPASTTDLPPTNASSAASPASRPPGPSIEPSTARQPPGPPPVPVVTVARPPRPGPQHHRLSMGGDRRVRTDGGRHQTAGHRTGGHQTAGHRTGGQQTADRRTLWTTSPGDRTPDGWTAGSRTPETGWVDTACRTAATDAMGCLLAVSTTATTPDRSIPAGRSSGQTPSGRATTGPLSSKDAEDTHAATDGSGHRRDRQLQLVRRRPAGALAHCCPRTITGRG
jgi:hypothetical protein